MLEGMAAFINGQALREHLRMQWTDVKGAVPFSAMTKGGRQHHR